MTSITKPWSRLGLGAAFAGVALAGCGEAGVQDGPAPAEAAETRDAAMPLAAASGEGEGAFGGEGEGGEGEGGISIAAAASDPVVFNAALAITRAHVIAARDAHAAGETRAAAEMFAHPVSEVLYDMRPVFEARGVAPFDDLLSGASAAVFDGEDAAAIAARTDEILKALDAAAAKAPDDGTSPAAVAAALAADQLERASDMYRAAAGTEAYEPYLDGYGYYRSAEQAFRAREAAIEQENAEAAAAIRDALDVLARAYPGAVRPDALDADLSALSVAVSKALLAL